MKGVLCLVARPEIIDVFKVEDCWKVVCIFVASIILGTTVILHEEGLLVYPNL